MRYGLDEEGLDAEREAERNRDDDHELDKRACRGLLLRGLLFRDCGGLRDLLGVGHAGGV